MNTKELQDKLFKTFDPNSGYTMEDFENELKNLNVINNDYKIPLKFVNKSNNPNPKFETDGASAFDIRAYIPDEKPIILKARGKAIIETGLSFNIPTGFEIQVRGRSGLAYKNSIICHFGTIDCDYLNEIKLILFNLGNEDFTINNGDRMAQGVLATCLGKKIVNLEQVDKLDKITERNLNGFGSTGLK